MSKSYKFFPHGKDGKKNRNVDIESVSIRRITGKDEDLAASIAEAKGRPGSFAEELIKLSVVAIDDKPISHTLAAPWKEFDEMDTATRTYVSKAFSKVNSIDTDDTTLDEPVPLE